MAPRFSSLAARVSLALTAGLLVAVTSSLPSPPASAAASFGSGDLVVYRVGSGTGTLSSAATAAFLDDYTTAGALVNAGSGALTGTPTQLATAATNEAFRGVAFAPTTDAGTQVSESPLPILLPLTAIALLLGGFLVTRRRRAPANDVAE